MFKPFYFILVGLFAIQAEAKVFKRESANFASYLNGKGYLSRVGNDPYADSSGDRTKLSNKTGASFNYSGELGLAIGLGGNTILIGVEFLQPIMPAGIIGANSSDAQIFDLKSEMSAIIPQLTIETDLSSAGGFRSFFAVGGGAAMVRLNNTYEFTSEGQALYGVGNYTERSDANTYTLHGYIGIETLFSDNVTIYTSAGYRHLKVNTFKYTKSAATINGNVTDGATVTNDNERKREVDLSGAFVSLGFRFYFL